MFLPSKKVLDEFRESGDFERFNILVSGSLLLFTISDDMVNDVDELLSERGLCLGELKHYVNRYKRAFNEYQRVCRSFFSGDGAKMDFLDDFESLGGLMRGRDDYRSLCEFVRSFVFGGVEGGVSVEE